MQSVNLLCARDLLYLIGAATAIVGIGFLIVLIAEVLTVVICWSIPAWPTAIAASSLYHHALKKLDE